MVVLGRCKLLVAVFLVLTLFVFAVTFAAVLALLVDFALKVFLLRELMGVLCLSREVEGCFWERRWRRDVGGYRDIVNMGDMLYLFVVYDLPILGRL